MTQSRTKKQIFLLFFLALFILVGRLFYPFLTIILWSGVIYAFINPLFERATRSLKPNPSSKKGGSIKKNIIAGIFSVLGILVIVVPLVYLFVALLRQVVDLMGSLIKIVETHPDYFSLSQTSPVGGFLYRMSGGSIDLSTIDVVHELKSFLSSSSSKIIGYSGTLLKNAASAIVNLAFMVFTLFFLLLDGKQLVSLVISAMPIERSYTTMFVQKTKESTKQLVLGYFVVAAYQAFAMFILSLAFGLKNNLVLAVLTAVSSFIPMVGTALVWVPLTVYIATTGAIGKAVAFLILAAFFVAFVDNFLRPKVLGDRLMIHPLLIFFSVLGGIKLFGFNGLILGPLIIIIFFSAVTLYDQLDQDKGAKPGSEEKSSE